MITLAVTTRSHLRGVRFFFPMLAWSIRIRRQLRDTPGCVRFASIIMGPREFWTITVWENRDKMMDFMRSGAHEDIMWEFSNWLDSFWLMRWRPTAEEYGHWKGLSLAQRKALPQPAPERSAEQKAALEAAWKALPRLRASSSPAGAPSLEYAPHQRRARQLVAGGVGAAIRVEVPRVSQTVAGWKAIREMRHRLLGNEDVLRCALGISRPRELYALVVFRHERAWRDFQSSEFVQGLRERWPDGVWTMRWEADNEFGHWDGLRLRRVKLGTKIAVPEKYGSMVRLEGDPQKAKVRVATSRKREEMAPKPKSADDLEEKLRAAIPSKPSAKEEGQAG